MARTAGLNVQCYEENKCVNVQGSILVCRNDNPRNTIFVCVCVRRERGMRINVCDDNNTYLSVNFIFVKVLVFLCVCSTI